MIYKSCTYFNTLSTINKIKEIKTEISEREANTRHHWRHAESSGLYFQISHNLF